VNGTGYGLGLRMHQQRAQDGVEDAEPNQAEQRRPNRSDGEARYDPRREQDDGGAGS